MENIAEYDIYAEMQEKAQVSEVEQLRKELERANMTIQLLKSQLSFYAGKIEEVRGVIHGL